MSIEKNLFNYSNQEMDVLLDIVQKGQRLYINFLPIKSLSFINSLKLIGDKPQIIEQKINDDFDIYSKELAQIKLLIEAIKNEFITIRNASFQEQLKNVNSIFLEIDNIFNRNKTNTELTNELKLNSISYKLNMFFSKAKRQTINDHQKLQKLFQNLNSTINTCKDLPNGEFNGDLGSNKNQLINYKSKINDLKDKFGSKIQDEFQQIILLKTNAKEIETKSLPLLQDKVNALAERIKNDSWAAEKVIYTEFYQFISDVEKLIRKKSEYFNGEDFFIKEFQWFQFYNGLSEKDKTIVDELKTKSDWRKSFLVFYLNSILINSAYSDLPINDEELKDLDKLFNEFVKEQLRFIKEFWFSKQIDSTREFEQNNVNLSVENLYNKRSSNRFKRFSLRQIVQYDANLFTNFFPVVLTSPDVASNLFKGMNGFFDIVVFDEASQLRLEDNLPAILKGKQIIVAGDEHQMPPSNYFSKVFDGAVEDEEELEEETEIIIDKDSILLSCESLLDFGIELNFQKKYLDFHYRS